ncbi:MAG: choice-of-anchor D domain-containing protein [Telluria sp.]
MNFISILMAGLPARAACALLLASCVLASAHADPARGRDLYYSNHCFDCHGAEPSAKAGATVAMLKHAIATEPAMHGIDSIANLTDGEIADIIDYLSAPASLPAPVLSPATLTFPATKSGESSAALTATLSNQGGAPLAVSGVFAGGDNGDDFTIDGTCLQVSELAPKASCTVVVTFAPTGVGPRTAAIYISHRKPTDRIGASSELDVSGTGTGTPRPTVGLSSTDVGFGDVVLGAASFPFDLVVTNKGQATLTWSSITFGGADAGAFTSTGDCAAGRDLKPGDTCTLTLSIQPARLGSFVANLVLASNASNGSVTVPLTANGVPVPVRKLEADTASVRFGLAGAGAGALRQQVVFTNTGNVGLNLGLPQLTGPASFAIDSASDCAYWLPAGAACTVTLTYAPTAAGADNATLAISSEAPDVKIEVSGTGTTAPVGRAVLSAPALRFDQTQVGAASPAQQLTVSNTGTASFRIGAVALSGAARYDFAADGSCAPNTAIAAGASCTVALTFKPSAAGARSARLEVTADTGAHLGVSLAGSANAIAAPGTSVLVQPAAYAFAPLLVGNPTPQKRFTLVNTGTDPVQLLAADITGPFQVVPAEGGCPALPFVLQPGTACDLAVAFVPTAAGSPSGGITLRTADPNQHWNIALSGQASMPNQRQNSGGGGCSAAQGGDDPMLAFLVVLSLAVLAWRRRQPRKVAP